MNWLVNASHDYFEREVWDGENPLTEQSVYEFAIRIAEETKKRVSLALNERMPWA